MALSIWQYLTKNNIPLIEQPLHSPDLAPCDLFLFPKVKEVIKGTNFGDVETIKRAVTMELKAIPKESFQRFIDASKKRMEKCITLEGNYFEEESMYCLISN